MRQTHKKNKKKIRRGKKGSALVEMALVIPIFLLVMVGIVEFSRVLMAQQVITNAAREGARTGSIYFDKTTAISKAVSISQNYLISSGIDPAPATVTPSVTTTGGIPALQVLIDYNYDSLLTGFIPGSPQTFALHSTVVMRREI